MSLKLSVPPSKVKNIEVFQFTDKNDNIVLGVQLDVDSYAESVYCKFIPPIADREFLVNCQIGKHTAIAEECQFLFDINHDYSSVFVGRISDIPEIEPHYLRPFISTRKGEIVIENDCWIGDSAVIMSGNIVANGAVVAADSVVASDVPPYAIVGGNPARLIRYRFDKETIYKLLKIQWWNWNHDTLRRRAGDLLGTARDFADKYELEADNRINKAKENICKYRNSEDEIIFVCQSDLDSDYPAIFRIMEQFSDNFRQDAQLLIYFKQINTAPEKISEFYAAVEVCESKGCVINVVKTVYSQESLVYSGDYLITSRTLYNVINCSFAHNGISMGITKGILSGFSTDIFAKLKLKKQF